MIPGELLIEDGERVLNTGRRTLVMSIANTGDRPIQVGSHYHFFETNPALHFDRKAARGYRLNIAAGTAVRFEPGQERSVELVELAGLTLGLMAPWAKVRMVRFQLASIQVVPAAPIDSFVAAAQPALDEPTGQLLLRASGVRHVSAPRPRRGGANGRELHGTVSEARHRSRRTGDPGDA